MNLNNQKNITLCQKALSTKELTYYANLCVIYNKLAQTQYSTRSPIRIEQRYSKALTNATKGNLEFLDDPECIFTQEEAKLLRSYSNYAAKLQEFQTASSLLKKALPSPDSEINENELDNYFDYMENTSNQTMNFNEDIFNHSRTFIGHEFYKKAQKAINAIQKVDKNHIPSSLRKITPELYGAEISGFKTLGQLTQDATNIFDKKETKKYEKELGTHNLAAEAAYMASNKISDTAYTVADTTRTVLHDHKKQIFTAALATLIAFGGYGTYKGVSAGYDQIIQHNQAVSTNKENGYKQPYSDKLVNDILQLQLDAQEISSYNITNLSPEQAEKIANVRNSEDKIISDYMSEVGQKYCDQLGYEFVNATNWYDKNSSEMPYYLELNYINKDGDEISKKVDTFDIDIEKTCDWEKTLDGSPTIDDLVKIANGIDKLAGKDVKCSKLLGIRTVSAEKSNNLEKNENIKLADDRDDR